ncbi:hypothetical protein CROQUDRAFT_94858 [Cronartium quercuum f. sp. fusiforme G11]|uniref:Uncharacterized protein n=1 Tax=Cronartium quercuum f. sp. fusiforme G11 TaxID=708437 RepID=A0A9P6NFE9_9BASI|nr:hypothetical protein CROQUDRAFT_94858 [Cronartium quercuum f. sp. fusiforme G11]
MNWGITHSIFSQMGKRDWEWINIIFCEISQTIGNVLKLKRVLKGGGVIYTTSFTLLPHQLMTLFLASTDYHSSFLDFALSISSNAGFRLAVNSGLCKAEFGPQYFTEDFKTQESRYLEVPNITTDMYSIVQQRTFSMTLDTFLLLETDFELEHFFSGSRSTTDDNTDQDVCGGLKIDSCTRIFHLIIHFPFQISSQQVLLPHANTFVYFTLKNILRQVL